MNTQNCVSYFEKQEGPQNEALRSWKKSFLKSIYRKFSDRADTPKNLSVNVDSLH